MHADIQNVFTPALAIGDPARFAGRQEQLDHVASALFSEGTQIVIFGNRGVGKSSLARQLEGLAKGDISVIDRLGLKPSAIPDYLVVSIECDDTIEDVRALVVRLLTDDTALAPWIPFKVEKKTSSSDASAGLNVKVITLGGKVSDTDTLEREAIETDVFSAFGNALNHILTSGVVKGVLFIIDEVDRIRNRSDLASVIRSRGADPRVKFALIGVGTTP
ncbi:AAA family ATPase, partial [Sphingomonas sp.]|uniref:AAA family ATPase n=1 Tax=Sphingomonas sp. TaxID=28214 RepID=UPI002FCB1D48